jgi:hypothetical protein
MFSLGIISKISCLKTFQNSFLGGGTAYVTATSEIRSLFVVIDGKKIILSSIIPVVFVYVKTEGSDVSHNTTVYILFSLLLG